MIDLSVYSPVEQIKDPLFAEKNIKVFVKRDDMIHPFISGNKWRKLKYILIEAERSERKHLVTFGGAFSNHLLATACAAAKFGFRSTGIVRGEEVSNDTLSLSRLFGMELHFVSRDTYRDKPAYFNENFGSDEQAFFIDEGGAGELAVKGCTELARELNDHYDHIFCAAGTGTTGAGIAEGVRQYSPDINVHIVPVLKGGEFLRDSIENYTSHPFELHTGYHFGGYAKSTEQLLSFIKNFCSSTGILIEPVYTGKMFFAVCDLIRNDYFTSGSRILAVHTGGLAGIHGTLSRFSL